MANIVANNPEIQGTFTPDLQGELEQLENEARFEELRLRDLIERDEGMKRERATLEDFDTTPPAKKAWVLVATTEEVAAEIEAMLREKYESNETRIEVSVGAK